MNVLTETYSAPPVNKKEILRYSGAPGCAEFDMLLDECLREAQDKLTYKVCFSQFKISRKKGIIDMGFASTDSKLVFRRLSGCSSVLVFAATIGIEIDRLIAKYGKASASKALFFQAIGAERIEALCHTFCKQTATKMAVSGYSVGPRFSPGYSDFPLEAQVQIFSALDCSRKIGLSLNDSLLMSPSKSVTALVGIKELAVCDVTD